MGISCLEIHRSKQILFTLHTLHLNISRVVQKIRYFKESKIGLKLSMRWRFRNLWEALMLIGLLSSLKIICSLKTLHHTIRVLFRQKNQSLLSREMQENQIKRHPSPVALSLNVERT